MAMDESPSGARSTLLTGNGIGRGVATGILGVLLAIGLLAGCGSDDEAGVRDSADDPTAAAVTSEALPEGLSAEVDHIFMPLTIVTTKVFEGEEKDPDSGETITLRVEEEVQTEPVIVGDTEVTAVEVHEYEDGELVERTLDYYAQGPDGAVYYMGEDVDDYEDGEISGHSGEWLAGVDGNLPGVFLPAEPETGDVFEQERVPGIAEDSSTVVALGVEITAPAGTFTGCMETEDVNPLDDAVEHKFYCPGVGLVREESEDGHLDLISYD